MENICLSVVEVYVILVVHFRPVFKKKKKTVFKIISKVITVLDFF